jgi:hypothetical protein
MDEFGFREFVALTCSGAIGSLLAYGYQKWIRKWIRKWIQKL